MSTGTQIDVVMPQMGVSVSEGTITKWLKRVGDTVALDEPLLEISTDKVDTEVPSPGEGVVTQILVEEGATVEVGTVLGVIARPAPPPRPPPPRGAARARGGAGPGARAGRRARAGRGCRACSRRTRSRTRGDPRCRGRPPPPPPRA